VDEIIKDIEDDRGQRQLMIVILGSNNLRRGLQRPEELMPLFRRIVEKVAATPQCHLVLSSIVPCPKTGEVFDVANDLIKSLANAYKNHCTFYDNLTKRLVDKNGGFQCHLFKRDELHLNNDGAKVIATGIHNFIMTLARSLFSKKR
jgi:lysophospholipase L1-like esterase